MQLAAKITPGANRALKSEVLPLAFRLIPGSPRPAIEIIDASLQRSWTV